MVKAMARNTGCQFSMRGAAAIIPTATKGKMASQVMAARTWIDAGAAGAAGTGPPVGVCSAMVGGVVAAAGAGFRTVSMKISNWLVAFACNENKPPPCQLQLSGWNCVDLCHGMEHGEDQGAAAGGSHGGVQCPRPGRGARGPHRNRGRG